ncbi:MAG TPA: TRAM domain-containing protein, partial [Devosia sp.]|nr:TRAM domain-containing protein [Devosia sp.]
LMERAQEVSVKRLAQKVGRTIQVLVDDVRKDENQAIARSRWDAPDIDGQVIIDNAGNIKPGDLVEVIVNDTDAYDLFATPLEAKK